MINNIIELFQNPAPLKTLFRFIIKKIHLFPYETRIRLSAVQRPHYGYCIYNSTKLASKLGYKKISIIEFGVAGGNGLLNIEYHVQEVKKIFDIEIEVYGFDTGDGLPQPIDFRDLPYHWKAGFFKMNKENLQNKISFSRLIFGNVEETCKTFFDEFTPAPIACIFNDLDFYSSTSASLKIFEGSEDFFLPRVYIYFDDTVGNEIELYNDFTGQRLAINEFNKNHENKKIAIPYHLLARSDGQTWHSQVFIFHDFLHSRYNDFISYEEQQLPL
jgi:hypothetical protein